MVKPKRVSPDGKVCYSLPPAVSSQTLDVDSRPTSSRAVISMRKTNMAPLFCNKTCLSRKIRQIRTRSMEEILKDGRSMMSNAVRVLGRPNLVTGRCDLTWTLLKSELKDSKIHRLKLNQALEVMHQSFDPAEDPVTHKDVVDDIIFDGDRDFYTAILETGDEVVSVANLKVHQGVVAEAPLVATARKFRRQGMLKVLMHEIENWLRNSGVERLVLPSAQSALKMWTSSSIGFSTMTEDEKEELLLAYDCLDFQDTIMCQKNLLKKNEKCHGYSSDGSTISHEEHAPAYIYVEDD